MAVAIRTAQKKAAAKKAPSRKSIAKKPAARNAVDRTSVTEEAAPCTATPEPVRAEDHPNSDSAALVDRVARAVERELAEIEKIVSGLQGKARPTEAERRARTLASLARTLSEVRRLRSGKQTQNAEDEPSAARDLDEFCKVLFKRLENMPERPAALPDPEDESGRNE